ncbi:MAG: polysaccharide export protein EpsE [Duganella sp.]
MKRYAQWIATALLAFGMHAANAADLLLGPSDVLKITVYNNADLSVETRISDAGTISYPLIGQVKIAGLSPAAAEQKLAGLLEAGRFVKQAQVNILVTNMVSQQVSVLGQVNRPGRYPIDSARTVLDMLALAGGATADGGETVTLVHKQGGTEGQQVLDVVALMRGGDASRNVALVGGDVLYVERAPRFYIYGEVQRPGSLRLERSMTVLQALAAGGGLTPRGTERGLRIKRRDAAGVLQTIDAKHDDQVMPDDVVYVKESLF